MKDLTYPKGNKTVVHEVIILPNYDINDAFDRLHDGFKQRNKYKQGAITEIRIIEKPNFMQIYAYNSASPLVSARGNEKDIKINFKQEDNNVKIEIIIDSYIARRK